jgi:formamidopyrimidine-DNA glycosylase
MPELPEVEVVCRGLSSLLTGRQVKSVDLIRRKLRYPLPVELESGLFGLTITGVTRRAKYILIHFNADLMLVWHLGMTGQFHVLNKSSPKGPHEHVRIELSDGQTLCYRDARRFGYAGLLTPGTLNEHIWFRELGPEPLSEIFDAAYLQLCCKHRKAPIKTIIMNAKVVVGVGNIYASEALFRSGIHPTRAAGRISLVRLERLVTTIKQVLEEAIEAGGSTIRDFVKADGKPGYFAHQFKVYGREGEACYQCGKPIRRIVQAGRSTFYCLGCQR